MSQMYYLNNSGTRWVIRPNNEYYFIVHDATRSAVIIRRKPKFFEQFGNFAAIYYSYNGRTHSSVTYSSFLKDVEHRAKQIDDSAIRYTRGI
jgi:hypothetical protein